MAGEVVAGRLAIVGEPRSSAQVITIVWFACPQKVTVCAAVSTVIFHT